MANNLKLGILVAILVVVPLIVRFVSHQPTNLATNGFEIITCNSTAVLTTPDSRQQLLQDGSDICKEIEKKDIEEIFKTAGEDESVHVKETNAGQTLKILGLNHPPTKAQLENVLGRKLGGPEEMFAKGLVPELKMSRRAVVLVLSRLR